MFSQPSLLSRKQFLQRSLMGFGSAFILPSLLQSCTDHLIDPGPGSGVGSGNPPLLGLSVDWNDDAKTMVTSAVEMIPEAGDILGGLVDIFWPSTKEDVWGEVKAQTEALVNQQISAQVYQQVSDDLTGLNNSLTVYLEEVKNGTPTEILIQWITTKNLFINALPHFQSVGNQLPLLGLFTQFANLYLGIIRDAVIAGQSWGRTPADHQQDIQDLQNAITNFSAYVTTTYQTGRSALQHGTKANYTQNEPFNTVNKYDRQMTLIALDFRDTWPYFDVTQYPNGTQVNLMREIYSDPFGTCKDSGDISIPQPAPYSLPTSINIWGGVRIDAVEVNYKPGPFPPTGDGPAGYASTGRMGNQNGGSTNSPTGGSINLSPNNPIVGVRTQYSLYQNNNGVLGPVPNGLQFWFYDGTSTPLIGSTTGVFNGTLGTTDTGAFGYTNEALSSIWINGVAKVLGTSDCIVFGFKFWKSPATTLSSMATLYVKTPKERSLADFVKAFPKLSVPANLISEELKAARKAYWAVVEARAKALK